VEGDVDCVFLVAGFDCGSCLVIVDFFVSDVLFLLIGGKVGMVKVVVVFWFVLVRVVVVLDFDIL